MDTKRITLVVGVAAALSLTFTGVAFATVTPGPNTAACLQATQIADRDAFAANVADGKVKAEQDKIVIAREKLIEAQTALDKLKTTDPGYAAAKQAVIEATSSLGGLSNALKNDYLPAAKKAHDTLDLAVKARNLVCDPPVTPTTTPVPTTVPPTTTATPPPTTTVVVPPPVVVQQPVVLAPQFITVPNVSSGVNTGDGSLA